MPMSLQKNLLVKVMFWILKAVCGGSFVLLGYCFVLCSALFDEYYFQNQQSEIGKGAKGKNLVVQLLPDFGKDMILNH